MRRALPVLTLVLLAPLIAEVSIGDVPFTPSGVVAALFFLPIYGGGAVLIRELVRRSGRGWASVLLLGVAYGIVEEGLALQSTFSPSIYHGIGVAMGLRVFGVNGVYTGLELVNHALFSTAVPILLTELAFRTRRDRPYLGRIGLVVAALAYLVGVGLVALSARTVLDPGYAAPLPLMVGSLVVVVVLGIVALGGLRRRVPRQGDEPVSATGAGTDVLAPPARAGSTPSPWLVAALAVVAVFGFMALLWIPGQVRAAFVQGPGVAGTALGALVLIVLAATLVVRWSRTPGWDDRHRLALAAGGLLGHTAIGVAMQQNGVDGLVGCLVVLAVTVLLLVLLARRVTARQLAPAPGDRSRTTSLSG